MRRTLAAVLLLAPLVACASTETGGSSDNATACDYMRSHLSGLSSATTGLSQGTQTNAEAAQHLQNVAKDFTAQASYSTGAVQTAMQTMAADLGRWHVALLDGSDPTTASGAVLNDLDTFGAACKAIGH